MLPRGKHIAVLLWGNPKGARPLFGTRLCKAKCSVLYALSALPQKCRCRRGGQGRLKRQESGQEFAAGKAAKDSPISAVDRAYMNPSSIIPTLGQVTMKLMLSFTVASGARGLLALSPARYPKAFPPLELSPLAMWQRFPCEKTWEPCGLVWASAYVFRGICSAAALCPLFHFPIDNVSRLFLYSLKEAGGVVT